MLLLEPKLLSALRGMLLQAPPVPLVGAPTPAERGLIAFALADLLHTLGADCPWTLLPQEPAGPPGEVVGVEVRVVLGQLVGLAWLFVDSALLRRACPSRRQLRSRRLGRLARLALRLSAEAGRLQLPAGELELLGEGDVILSPTCPAPGGEGPRPGWLSVGGGGFAIVVEGDRATLTSCYQKGEPRMSPAKEVETETLVEELPVELVVELGRVELTGAQVLDLDAGDVVALERPLAGRVDLRVSGRLIARGELVNIDGEAGVRLVEVFED
jgi:type III secretion system YscQ/HrcQ family protein